MFRSALVRIAVLVFLAAPTCVLAARKLPTTPTADGPSCSDTEHRVRFVNRCWHPIWVAEVGNSTGYCTTDSQCQQDPAGIQVCNIPGCTGDADCPALQCTTSGDCPPGGTCLGNGQCTGLCDTASKACYCSTATGCPGGGQCQSGGSGEFPTCQGGLCTFVTVGPNPKYPQRWRLGAAGKRGRRSLSICMPATWGGRFWGRTGCTLSNGKLTCATGQCGDGKIDCTGNSASGVTLFEPTFDAPAGSGTVDYYDASLVSGYNLPIEVKPSVATCVKTGDCTSDLNATCPTPLQITNGTCSTARDCKAGAPCVTGQCVVGCSDPCTVCTNDPTNAALDCASNRDFYCCEGAQASNSCNSASATCFSDDDCKNLGNGSVSGTCDQSTHLCSVPCTSDAQCPGSTCNTSIGECAWAVVACSGSMACPVQTAPQPQLICESGILSGGEVCVPQASCCGPYNPSWLSAAARTAGPTPTPGPAGSPVPVATPWPNAFKQACPTAYSYQFDDPTSLFTCAPTGGDKIDYKVTFCPKRKAQRSLTGLPPRAAAGAVR